METKLLKFNLALRYIVYTLSSWYTKVVLLGSFGALFVYWVSSGGLSASSFECNMLWILSSMLSMEHAGVQSSPSRLRQIWPFE